MHTYCAPYFAQFVNLFADATKIFFARITALTNEAGTMLVSPGETGSRL
jgi:hypothetical protein